MRHGVESQGLFEQLSIKLQDLARVCRACIRHDKADIQILRMLGEPQDEALFREVYREGAELNTEVSCDIASALINETLPPSARRLQALSPQQFALPLQSLCLQSQPERDSQIAEHLDGS